MTAYVTPSGLAAAAVNSEVVRAVAEAMTRPDAPIVRKALEEGWLAEDRRSTTTVVQLVIAPPVSKGRKPLVRYAVTKRKPGPMQPEVKRVYDALSAGGPLTTPEILAACPGMVINTLRYATQLLRQMGAISTVK